MATDLRCEPSLSEWRLQWYPRLLMLALAAAFVVSVATGDGSTTASGRLGGDYPAFYGAGTIVLDGDLDDLYDPATQSGAQVDLLGEEGGYLPFGYPPHVAVAYSPLAGVPYRVSYVVHTALMTGALLAALAMLRPVVGTVDRRFSVWAAGAMAAFPMFRALGAGQNTALSLLLMAAAWRGLADDRPWLTGVALGLLLYRPQYAIPLIGLTWLARQRRAALVAVAVGAATWALTAAVDGVTWTTDWLHEVGPFLAADVEKNADIAISWLGVSEATIGAGHPVAAAVGYGLAAVTALVLVAFWSRPDRYPLDLRVAVAAAGVLLLSPHTIFYDAGLATLTVIVAVDRGWLDGRAAAGIALLGFTHLASSALGFTPVALIVMVGFVAVAARVAQSETDRVLPIQERWSRA